MKRINKKINIPYYIFEKINEYIELVAQRKCKTMKWENIKVLLNLAVMNNRLSKEQAKFLKIKFEI